ncbi:hypothetical protein DEO72_LG9g3541 [Vigna unguiculata]|uniref:Uncharacterized protein n=1 Tax=Vigna unguiculata TaxID=3917 RepID=A0A4D6N6H6_VIGUN|nr:hypothetical protein DEO72_LG9g3541 [Vigna unguiculata]
MMVMVELSTATQSPPYKTLLIDCATKCELECAPLLLPPASGFSYLVCLFTCRLECLGKPTDAVPGCVKSCDVRDRDLTSSVADSCVKKCLKM